MDGIAADENGAPRQAGDVLTEGLAQYRIGAKIRRLRQAKDLGLAQLGEHSGLSAGMLSKIERGQQVPTLQTLLRISMVFGVGLDHFFSESDAPVLEVVRRADRLRLPDRTDGRPRYLFESLDYPVTDKPFETYAAEFLADRPLSEPHSHAGDELIFVIEGRLEVSIHERTVELGPGDSLYFDARFDHAYRCLGDRAARAVVVVATP